MSAGEPMHTTKWHHSSFAYAIKREFIKDIVTMVNTSGKYNISV